MSVPKPAHPCSLTPCFALICTLSSTHVSPAAKAIEALKARGNTSSAFFPSPSSSNCVCVCIIIFKVCHLKDHVLEQANVYQAINQISSRYTAKNGHRETNFHSCRFTFNLQSPVPVPGLHGHDSRQVFTFLNTHNFDLICLGWTFCPSCFLTRSRTWRAQP